VPWNSAGGGGSIPVRGASGGGWGGGAAPPPLVLKAPPKSKEKPKKKDDGGFLNRIKGPSFLDLVAKTGLISHHAADVAQRVPDVWASSLSHPWTLTKQLGMLPVGLTEGTYALGRAYAGKVAKDPAHQVAAMGSVLQNPALALGLAGGRDTHRTAEVTKAIVKSVAADYRNRYGPDWREYGAKDPLANFSDMLSVFGGTARAASVLGAAAKLAPENTLASRAATMLSHPAAVWRESSQFEPIHLAFDPKTGNRIEHSFPASRSPLRAYTQQMNKAIAEQWPTLPMAGARSRINRGRAMTINRTVQRLLAAVPGTHELGSLNKAQRARAFWGSQVGYDEQDLQHLYDALKTHFDKPLTDDAEFHDLVQKAVQTGFGPETLANVELAIKHAQKFPEIPDESKLGRAIQGMEHMTRMTEESILNAHGYSGIENEIKWHESALKDSGLRDPGDVAKLQEDLAALYKERDAMRASYQEMFAKRRRILADFSLAARAGKIVSKERDAWMADFTKRWGSEKAGWVRAAWDRAALVANPDDPARVWRDSYGMPSPETAEAFALRQEQGGGRPFYQYALGPYGGEQAHLYSSPLHDAVAEISSSGLQVGQLRKLFAKHKVDVGELTHSGVEAFLEGKTKSDRVTKAELEQLLASPENAFNLVLHHWTNDKVGEAPPFLNWEEGGILSRPPGTGE